MSEKLKPCPFCGGHDIVSSAMNRGINYRDSEFYLSVTCKKCGAKISVGADLGGVPFECVEQVIEETREKWNRRTGNAN